MDKTSDEAIHNITKLQDDDGHWYWIPNEWVDEFNKSVDDLAGKEYMDDPEAFDAFNDKYEACRTGGSPDCMPDAYMFKPGPGTNLAIDN